MEHPDPRLARFFTPERIALVGASPKEGKVGNILLKNLMVFKASAEVNSGKEVGIYPVNPHYETIWGIPCYPSVLQIADRVDLAVVAVPAASVPEVLEECGKKGIANVVVISAGFKEVGQAGAILESELVRICEAYHIQLIGPNSMGILNTHVDLNATFGRTLPAKGPIAFLSQSGAFVLAVIDWSRSAGVGFSKVVSLGNKAVLDECDFLEYLARDDETDVIALYLEDVRDGRRFMEVVSWVTKTKPVVAMKSGKTDAGARAASSHTGSIAGSIEAFRTAFHQAGVIEADSIEELFDFALTLSRIRELKGGVAIVTNSGGPGVMAADALDELGLELASFERGTLEQLRALQLANFYNPVDVRGDADSAKFGHALRIVSGDKSVGVVLAILSPTGFIDFPQAGEYLLESNDRTPIIPVFMGGEGVSETIERFRARGIQNYFDPARAVRALHAVKQYTERRSRVRQLPPHFTVDWTAVADLIKPVEGEVARMGLGFQGFKILSAYGIPVPRYGAAKTAEEALEVADRIGYPVAMKILSPDIMHKTDIGCVKLGVSREAVARTFYEIIHQAERYTSAGRIEGVLIQEMVEGGKEVIVGMKRDPHFGPLIMFGLGGIYVEVFKDVSFGIAPLTAEDALDMLKKVKAYRILRGVRGERMSDIGSLVEVILRFSQLCTDVSAILEADLNPIKVFDQGKGCCVIDLKLVIEGPQR